MSWEVYYEIAEVKPLFSVNMIAIVPYYPTRLMNLGKIFVF